MCTGRDPLPPFQNQDQRQRSHIEMLRNLSRLKKELKLLTEAPGPGISAALVDGNILELLASIVGPEESPYAAGTFQLSLKIPENYPFEPPKAQFITPIYHPNIDSEGRICLDTLKPQPQGSWAPSITLNTLLLSIRLLLMHPNADDGLVPDITELFRRDYGGYRRNAEEHTLKYAILHDVGDGNSNDGDNIGGIGSAAASASTDGGGIAAAGDNTSMGAPSVQTTRTVCTEDTTTNTPVDTTINHSTCTNTITSDTHEFVSNGFTLIGCVPGSIGQVLYVSAIDSAVSDDVNNEQESSVGSGGGTGEESDGGGKRQRVD